MPVEEVLSTLQELTLSSTEQEIGARLLLEVGNRLQFLVDVGWDT